MTTAHDGEEQEGAEQEKSTKNLILNECMNSQKKPDSHSNVEVDCDERPFAEFQIEVRRLLSIASKQFPVEVNGMFVEKVQQ